ncbi:hypothetical protein JW877_05230 [bacterium]|nr:hypothetical protein [bacterium]
MEWSDDPAEIKAYNRSRKEATQIKTIIVNDRNQLPPPTISEWLHKTNFSRSAAVASIEDVPPEVLRVYEMRQDDGLTEEQREHILRNLFRDRPEPGGSSELMDFSGDKPVRVDYGPERQPDIATRSDGVIHAVWAEYMGSSNAIMHAKSEDAGSTWTEPVIVDNVGTNYFPQIAVWGSGYSARVHVAYNYLDFHVHDVIDIEGGYMGRDTVWEGDVYYSRSNNGGNSFGHFQAIANNDIDLSDYGLPSISGIPTSFHYDEGGADISVDEANNVYISYYNQSDEGHILNVALWIIYLIIYYLITGGFGLPPFWFDYNWYCVEMRCSSNGGADFNSAIEVEEEWFWNYSYNAHDVYGSGGNAVVHIAYTDVGVAIPLLPPLSNGNVYYRRIRNPLYSPSRTSSIGGWVGYVAPGGLQVDFEGNPKIGYTDIVSSSNFDVWYTRSTNGGISFNMPGVPVAASSADQFEPKLAIDLANNTFMAWSDRRNGTYDIYSVWSEDGGLTLRPDQYQVNTYSWSDQYVPGLSLYLSTCERRMDVDWWDRRSDEGDIYYANARWWRTDLNIILNDTLANSMEGTLTLTYTSFGQVFEREISTGYHIVYHDSLTSITLDQMSSGSSSIERWIWSESGDWSETPAECGNVFTIMYYNQYFAIFDVTKANSGACLEPPPVDIDFQYEYFSVLYANSTICTTWADVASFYHYPSEVPEDPREERWFCPEPVGRILTRRVAPLFYFQWQTPFLNPLKRNHETCTHLVPSFPLEQRYYAGIDVGGITPIYEEWTDCGSFYEYHDPLVISDYQRWDITAGGSGILLGLSPIQPDCYHQWTPLINLIGPYCPGNTVWTEHHYRGGVFDPDISLCGTYTEWTDCGSQLTFSEFTTLGWVARDPRSWEHITSMFLASIRYGNVVTITIENDFGYGFVGVDSLTVSVPYLTGWVPGSEHVITAISPQTFGHTRYVFSHWSDGGDTSHSVISVHDSSFTAYFNLQYQLEIISEYGEPYGDGWYDEGAAATFYTTTFDSAVAGIRHVFNGWEGDGRGAYTGPDTGATVIMNNPITETADWSTQYYLEVTYAGCDTFTPRQTGEGWYNDATHDSITTDSLLVGGPGDSIRYIFDRWESFPTGASFGRRFNAHTDIYMNRPYEARAIYLAQYRFWIFNPDDVDTPVPPAGEYWYTTGDSVTGSVTSPAGSLYCLGYEGTGSLEDGTGSRFDFIIDAPSSVTWLWGDQFVLEVIDTTGWLLAFAHADPPAGTNYYIPGTSDIAFVDLTVTLGGNRYYCTGYHGTGSLGDGDTNIVAFTMTETSTLEWLWEFQHRFIVRDSIVGGIPNPHYDSPDPDFGIHWFETETEIVGSIRPADGDYRCIGYDGSGSLPDGPGSGFTFTIEAPSQVTWLWAHRSEVESLIVYSDHGTCVPPGSPDGIVNWFLTGTPITAWTTLLSPGIDGERFICTGWTGTGPVPRSGSTNTVDIVMDSSGTLTWEWKTQFRLVINNPYGCDDPFPDAGEHWYDEGTIINCHTEDIDTIAPDSIMYCIGFTGTGRSLDGTDTTRLDFSFELMDPVEITWLWESYLVPLIIFSEHGEPSPAGTTYYIPGTEITALVNSPAYDPVIDGTRYLSTGFTGTGSAPPSGAVNYVNFIIHDTTTITWHWQTQHRLVIECWSYFPGDTNIYGNPVPAPGDHWYDEGTYIRGSVTNPDPFVDTMVCVGFVGTGAALPSSPQSEFELDLTEPSSVTWLWYPMSMCARLTVISAYDHPHPYGVTWWLLGNTVDASVDSIVYSGGRMIVCMGYHGTGSIDSAGTDNNVSFEIWEETYLIWDWSENLIFTVNNPRGYGLPDPPAGSYSYPTGSYVSGEMGRNPDWDPILSDSFYCLGFYGSGNLPPVSPQTDFSFMITINSSLTWRWAPSESVAALDVYTDYGSPTPYGRTYWLIGSTVNAQVEEFVNLTPGVRAYCTGWLGTGDVRPDGDNNSMTFEIWRNSSIRWQWEIQYSFVIQNEGGYDTPVPPASTYWYPESTLVEGYITDNPAGPRDTMYCIGYEGTGSAPPRSHQTDFSFYLMEPSTLTWLWAGESSVRQLIVISEHDNPMPYGTTYWLIGEYVFAQVDSVSEFEDSSSGYFCTGWLGTGSADSLGYTYWTDFDIFDNTTITWLWEGQYFIALDYEGSGEAPFQEGEGWYSEGDTVEIYSETPVGGGSGIYWGFVWWSSLPSGALIEDTMSARTYIVVDASYILTAHYNQAIHHIIKKDPESDIYGWIMVDDDVFDSISIISQWWGIGSVHDIGVSEFDTSASARFSFFEWSDRGERLHRTDPVPGGVLDTTYRYIAYYTTLFMCPIFKNPLHTSGSIFIDREEYDSVSSVIAWWYPGSVHEIGVTSPDFSDTMSYYFENWSDGGDIVHYTDTITGPTAFVAMYDTKYRLLIRKDPPQPYGWLLFERDTVRDTHSASFWIYLDTTYTIEVSEYDMGPVPTYDSIYIFSEWESDPGAPIRRTVSYDSHAEEVARYLGELFNLSFWLNIDYWDLETMDPEETATMEERDMIKITNDGNCPIDFGLRVSSVVCGGIESLWIPGYSSDYNKFTLRARFNDSSTPPTMFNPSLDYVKSTTTWATTGGLFPIFGEGGVFIYPDYPVGRHPDPQSTENLWMQFHAPTSSSRYAELVIITVDLIGKPHLP